MAEVSRRDFLQRTSVLGLAALVSSALPVAELRGQADAFAREIREVDVRIQRTNWEVDLLD